VSGINPTSGAVGTTVTITGSNFTGVSAIKFSNNVTANFTVNGSGTQITTTVPSGAVTGQITISKPNCPDTQTPIFTVPPPPTTCPTVSSINPTSGAINSSVIITGTNFTGVNAVRFVNNVSANFTVNSNTQITATVPNGAVNGPITISKPNCSDVQTPVFTVSQCQAQRLLSGGYVAGQPLQVVIQVTPPANTQVYAVEDTPPAGWAVSGIDNGGQRDAGNGKVKWGPFFDNCSSRFFDG
jgi:hypothetical protein